MFQQNFNDDDSYLLLKFLFGSLLMFSISVLAARNLVPDDAGGASIIILLPAVIMIMLGAFIPGLSLGGLIAINVFKTKNFGFFFVMMNAGAVLGERGTTFLIDLLHDSMPTVSFLVIATCSLFMTVVVVRKSNERRRTAKKIEDFESGKLQTFS